MVKYAAGADVLAVGCCDCSVCSDLRAVVAAPLQDKPAEHRLPKDEAEIFDAEGKHIRYVSAERMQKLYPMYSVTAAGYLPPISTHASTHATPIDNNRGKAADRVIADTELVRFEAEEICKLQSEGWVLHGFPVVMPYEDPHEDEDSPRGVVCLYQPMVKYA